MADLPDRGQVRSALAPVAAALKRLSRALLSIGFVLAFVLVALAIAVYVFNPLMFQAAADSPQNVLADEAQVFESTTTAIGCSPNGTGNAAVDGYQLLGARHLTITGNVTLPDASYTLTDPRIIERSNDTFVLAVDHRPTSSQNRSCQGLSRYTAKVQLPYGTNEYELTVRHGENRTLRIIERS